MLRTVIGLKVSVFQGLIFLTARPLLGGEKAWERGWISIYLICSTGKNGLIKEKIQHFGKWQKNLQGTQQRKISISRFWGEICRTQILGENIWQIWSFLTILLRLCFFRMFQCDRFWNFQGLKWRSTANHSLTYMQPLSSGPFNFSMTQFYLETRVALICPAHKQMSQNLSSG